MVAAGLLPTGSRMTRKEQRMLRRHTLRTTAITVTLGALCWALSAFSADAPAKGDAKLGLAVFKAKACATCHKADGTGGVKLTGNPTPNWKDPKTWADPKRKDMDSYLRECITNGRPKSGMVAWGKTGQVKPADIENLIAYIHTFKPGKTASATAKTGTTAPAKTTTTPKTGS